MMTLKEIQGLTEIQLIERSAEVKLSLAAMKIREPKPIRSMDDIKTMNQAEIADRMVEVQRFMKSQRKDVRY